MTQHDGATVRAGDLFGSTNIFTRASLTNLRRRIGLQVFLLFFFFASLVLYCIVLYCIVLYCIVLYCIVLYCIVLYCIVLYCIVFLPRSTSFVNVYHSGVEDLIHAPPRMQWLLIMDEPTTRRSCGPPNHNQKMFSMYASPSPLLTSPSPLYLFLHPSCLPLLLSRCPFT